MKERYQLYIALIQQLLVCPEGEQVKLFRANLDLIDLGLLNCMKSITKEFTNNNCSNEAIFLQNIANRLIKAMGVESIETMQSIYKNFLMEIFRAIAEKHTQENKYKLLKNNLDLLNSNLLFVLEFWGIEILSNVKTEQAVDIAALIFEFGCLVYQFPSEQCTSFELAIIAYKLCLTIYNKENLPSEWAVTQNNLGIAYRDRIKGNKEENLELAIVACNNALIIHTQNNFPYEWAKTQNNLGIAYRDRIKGNKEENLELAIAAFNNALIIRTQNNFPYEWAKTQNNLGIAYRDRIKGNKEENLELAIAAFNNALIIRTQDNFPYKWAMTQNNLGVAYRDRIKGNKEENLELAIAAFNNALIIRTQDNFPYEWSMTQNNLGNAYINRIKGDKEENLELAIAAFNNALIIRTQNNFPYDWAGTQNNLGTTYRNRIKGDKEENLELAIAAFNNALIIWTQNNFPYDWAGTQNNLGTTYRNRIKGDKEENLELAIAAFNNALIIWTQKHFSYEWAVIQNNLGNAYSDRIKGDKEENLELAIAAFNNALIIRTQKHFSYEWAMTQNNLSTTYINRIKGDKEENLELAISSFTNALIILTQENFPLECLQTARNLGNLQFTQGNWKLAIKAYQKAIAAIEITRNWATKDSRRQEIIAESMDVYEKAIQACVKSGKLDLAIEITERSRARHLVDLMASNNSSGNGDIPETIRESLAEYEELQKRINSLRYAANSQNNRELATSATRLRDLEISEEYKAELEQLEAEKQDIWLKLRSLDPVLAGQQQIDGINFTRIQQLIENNSTAILCSYSTWKDTYIFVIYKDKAPEVHTCIGETIGTLNNEFLSENWLKPYYQNFSRWYGNIFQVSSQLSQRLQLEQLIENYLQGIEELIIIPHLWLHQIPFAALPVNSSCLDSFNKNSVSPNYSEELRSNRDNRKPNPKNKKAKAKTIPLPFLNI